MGKKSADDKIGDSADPGAPLEHLPGGQNAQSMAQDDRSMGSFNGATDLVEDPEIPDEIKLDPKVQVHLGTLLRSMYQALVDEPVPEKFLKMLEELDRTESDG